MRFMTQSTLQHNHVKANASSASFSLYKYNVNRHTHQVSSHGWGALLSTISGNTPTFVLDGGLVYRT